ncbi:tetratricopeptide repeat protein [Streptomyces sp. NPDC004658]|uniref:tetratricopeptide repeat protein n=1 Tax=Streptomyces sp. NPDC004658 TaxID=3154672 RepID=UPI0033AB06D2
MANGAREGGVEEAFRADLRRLGELHRILLGGSPGLSVLARAAGVRSKSTVSAWLDGDRTPKDVDHLLGVVRTLRERVSGLGETIPGVDQDLLRPGWWRARYAELAGTRNHAVGQAVRGAQAARALERHDAQSRRAALPDLPRPVADWHPGSLGVHPAIPGTVGAPGGTAPAAMDFVLPAYVPRDHDRHLRQRLEQAALGQDATLVLVLGESCTGKTRTAFEAVRTCLPDWDLVFPKDSDSLLGLLDAGVAQPRTVLWLDEGQNFLARERGEEVAAQLRRLLERPQPVVVLMTMWREHHRSLTVQPGAPGKDPHPQARALLTQAIGVRVPAAFSPAALRGINGTRDPSLAVASLTSGDGTLTQTLAAGPQLVEFYEAADDSPACYGKAVLTAAMDARRLGHGPALPDGLLEAAAPAYLSETQRAGAGPDWFAGALDHGRQRVKGVVAPLGEVPAASGMGARPGRRRLADYLDQYGRLARSYVCPGAPFWEAAERFAADAADLHELADSARRRGRYALADALFRRAAERGHAPAWTEMANLRETRGCREEAVELIWKGHHAGDATALLDLASWYEEDEDLEAARRLAPEIARTGDPTALLFLAENEHLVGGDGEVERLARAAAGLGAAAALTFLGRRRMLAGERGAAERYFRSAIAAGDHSAAFELARMRLAGEHDVPGAVAAAQQAAELGDFFTLGVMAQLVMGVDPAEGERMARQAAALGGLSPARMVNLSFGEYMGRQQGLAVLADRAEAADGAGAGEAVLRAAADEGDLHAMAWLAQRQWAFGDPAEAERLYEHAAEGGHAPALLELARIRQEAGHLAEAERLCRVAVDAGEPSAVGQLARTWEVAGRTEHAGSLVLHGLDADGEPARPWLPSRPEHDTSLGMHAVKGWILIQHGRPTEPEDP